MLMDYRIKRVGQSDELEHALFGIGKKKSSSSLGNGSGQQGAKKGSTWSNHLYIARQKAGDGWRYFYSQAELKAAQAKQAGQKAAKTVGDTARKGLATVKRSAADASKKANDVLSGRYKRQVDENIDRSKDDIRRRSDANPDKYMGIFENNPYENSRVTDKIIETSKLGASEADNKRFYDAINTRNRNWDAIRKDITRINENERLQKGLLYKISDLSIKGNALVSKGKSAISKFLSDESAMVKEAWNGSIAKKAIGKGKAAVDKLGKVLSGAKGANTSKAPQKENNTEKSEGNEAPLPKNNRQYNGTSKKADNPYTYNKHIGEPEYWENLAKKVPQFTDDWWKIQKNISDAHLDRQDNNFVDVDTKTNGNTANRLPKNNRQYNGTSKKAEGDETRATKDMYKNSSDEYIEALYFNSRKNDGSGVSKYLENEYNYRKAAQEANYLGRLTDSLSDDAEAALKKYGKNSDTYKRAYEKMEEAFDQLHEAEMELARYEKNR